MKKTRTLWLLLALSAVSACGGSGDSDSNANTLDRGINTDPETLDGHKARSIQAANVLRDLGEGLMRYSATGDLIP